MDKKQLLNALPPDARRKLDDLNRKSDAAYAELAGLGDERRAAIADLHHFQVVRGGTDRRRSEDDKLAKVNDEREAELRVEVQRLQSISDDASARSAPIRELVARCFDWLGAVVRAGATIVVAPETKDRTNPNQAAVATLRAKIKHIADQITAVENSPVPTADLLAQARVALDDLAQRGQPRIAATLRAGDPVGLAKHLALPSIVTAPGGAGAGYLTNGAMSFLAWLLRDTLDEKIAALITALPQDGALDTNARAKKLRDLAEQKLAVEREEELMIVAAEQSGVIIPRRSDCDVRAVLGVTDE